MRDGQARVNGVALFQALIDAGICYGFAVLPVSRSLRACFTRYISLSACSSASVTDVLSGVSATTPTLAPG